MKLEISLGGSMYTPEIGRCYKSGLLKNFFKDKDLIFLVLLLLAVYLADYGSSLNMNFLGSTLEVVTELSHLLSQPTV